MRVLLSIKPEFAFKIFDGIKKFEFRKVIFKKPEIKTVVVYASSPVKRVIGEFEIDDIITSNPKDLWETTKLQSGITEDFFYKYFANREVAHAIKIKETKKYHESLCIKEDFNVLPPQSYVYL
ncbi:ASCH domain-containing protein [Flavivirga abyssicola]|uniref:ASCH domain-containing protein n=1 Tax=Flavivirga abyssicola TaxID=3063533 RepID=UPI0026E04032|nr:ASCH domain-containing protein [Flavivirga sp. MEBiC07777]WVK14045.1 ASCH domain-containing protein [Flavivirga sp. MEBiC07777]